MMVHLNITTPGFNAWFEEARSIQRSPYLANVMTRHLASADVPDGSIEFLTVECNQIGRECDPPVVSPLVIESAVSSAQSVRAMPTGVDVIDASEALVAHFVNPAFPMTARQVVLLVGAAVRAAGHAT